MTQQTGTASPIPSLQVSKVWAPGLVEGVPAKDTVSHLNLTPTLPPAFEEIQRIDNFVCKTNYKRKSKQIKNSFPTF